MSYGAPCTGPVSTHTAMLLVLATIGCAIAQETGFVRIFDGATLDGWTVRYNTKKDGARPCEVTIVDSAMHISPTQYLDMGYVEYSETKPVNFVLTLEGRFLTSGANSGIFFRAQKGAYGPWVSPGYELNFRHSSSAPMSGKANLELYGPEGKYPLLQATYKQVAVGPVGQWNRFRITVQGNTISVDYNDCTDAVTFNGLTHNDGYIGLQAEAGTFEYRNINLKSLDPTAVSADTRDLRIAQSSNEGMKQAAFPCLTTQWLRSATPCAFQMNGRRTTAYALSSGSPRGAAALLMVSGHAAKDR